MANRLALQTMLEQLLGSRNVYYQPPASISMSYPAIVYGLKNIETRFANNSPYTQSKGYDVTVIDSNPDSGIVTNMMSLPGCRFDRQFKSDNLNHTVFTLYF